MQNIDPWGCGMKLKNAENQPSYYLSLISGLTFMFTRDLTLTLENSNGWISDKNGEDWIFKKDHPVESQFADTSRQLASVLHSEAPSLIATDIMSDINVDNVVSVFINLDDEALEKANSVVEAVDNNYRCLICGFLSSHIEAVYNHLEPAHGDEWKKKDNTEVSSGHSKLDVGKELNIGNIHTDPNWCLNLKKSFLNDVVPNWSKKTRDAWSANAEIMDKVKFRQIRAEIKDSLVDHIVQIFGITKTPSVKILTEIVKDILSTSYPFMFSQAEGSANSIPSLNFGRGLGGVKGVVNLPCQMWDAIYNKQIRLRMEVNNKSGEECTADDVLGGAARPRKGKKPHKQGKLNI